MKDNDPKKILSLQDADYKQVALVGGKAASLGEMLKVGINVPPGFVVTTAAYKEWTISSEIKQKILQAFDELGAERVAVRSSAVAEDSTNASWAGQLETFLNVGRDGLIEAIENCWESMHSERAKSYAKKNNIGGDQQAVAAVVQAMVDSDISGVLFTANPINSNLNESVIEAIYGLGELLVQGIATPESFMVNNNSGEVLSQTEHRQTKKLVWQDGRMQEVDVAEKGKILTAAQIQQVIEQGQRIQGHYGKPQDIEFAIQNDKLFIVQSRPITTLNNTQEKLLIMRH